MTLEVEPGEACKKELLKGLEGCPQLEQVEIVANPSLQFFMEVSFPDDYLAISAPFIVKSDEY